MLVYSISVLLVISTLPGVRHFYNISLLQNTIIFDRHLNKDLRACLGNLDILNVSYHKHLTSLHGGIFESKLKYFIPSNIPSFERLIESLLRFRNYQKKQRENFVISKYLPIDSINELSKSGYDEAVVTVAMISVVQRMCGYKW